MPPSKSDSRSIRKACATTDNVKRRPLKADHDIRNQEKVSISRQSAVLNMKTIPKVPECRIQTAAKGKEFLKDIRTKMKGLLNKTHFCARHDIPEIFFL